MFSILKYFHHRKAGITLIEVAASIVITGIIALSASAATGQVLNQTGRNSHYTLASRNTLNALHWMTRDIMMAQNISEVASFPLTDGLSLQWKGWDNSVYSATYNLTDGKLSRIYNNGTSISTTLIAENINPDEALTYCVSGNGTLTVCITASAGSGSRTVDVTKVIKVTCRPKL
jgi:type II secretory pathway pseudopilin PulG